MMDMIDNYSPEQKREIIAAMRKKPALLESNGDCWSMDEDNKLCNLYDEGYGVTDLALMMGRTENAIWLRLSQCGKLQRCGGRRDRTRIITCRCVTCPLHEDCERYNSASNVPQGMLVCYAETRIPL